MSCLENKTRLERGNVSQSVAASKNQNSVMTVMNVILILRLVNPFWQHEWSIVSRRLHHKNNKSFRFDFL